MRTSYALPMAREVKTEFRPVTQTRVSSKHQVTIGKGPFEAAGLNEGDVLMVRALGPGRVELTRLEEIFAKHRGRFKGGNQAREEIERERRKSWR